MEKTTHQQVVEIYNSFEKIVSNRNPEVAASLTLAQVVLELKQSLEQKANNLCEEIEEVAKEIFNK